MMRRMKAGWRTPVAAALIGMAAPAAAQTIKVGQPAPDTELTMLDGSKVKLSSLRGQVVLLNFWATWCVPCRVELPLLDNYYRLTARHGFRVFAATTEDSAPIHRLKPIFATLAITPVRRMTGSYASIKAVPTNYVIDRAGIVRHARSGAFALDDLNRILVPLLNEAPPAVAAGG
jgi:thiol-disulfide isomerase/thioredoxin